MKEVRAEIYIEATAEWVWRVLTNFEAYPKWNPFIRNIERSELRPGAKPRVSVHLADGTDKTFRPVLVAVVPAAELRWRSSTLFGGLFDCEHTFTIEPHRTGIRFTQCQHFSGWLAWLLARSMVAKTRPGVEDMNKSLKRVAEAKY